MYFTLPSAARSAHNAGKLTIQNNVCKVYIVTYSLWLIT